MAYQVYSMMNFFYIIFLGIVTAGVIATTAMAIIFPLVSIKRKGVGLFVVGCIAYGMGIIEDLVILVLAFSMLGNGGILDTVGIAFVLILIPFALARHIVFIVATIKRTMWKARRLEQ